METQPVIPNERPVLRGQLAKLRAPQPADKAARLAVGNHSEFVRMLGQEAKPLTPEAVGRWYERIQHNPLQWVVEVEGRCVGAAQLHNLATQNGRVRYAVALFDPGSWNRGVGTEVTRLILTYAFEVLQLHRVDLRVLEYNRRAIRAYERAGFRREGLERETVLIEGKWYGDVIMGILESDFRREPA